MARPWQLDIRVQCPQCVRTMDATVDLRQPAAVDTRTTCPYCAAAFIYDRAPGLVVSIGKRG